MASATKHPRPASAPGKVGRRKTGRTRTTGGAIKPVVGSQLEFDEFHALSAIQIRATKAGKCPYQITTSFLVRLAILRLLRDETNSEIDFEKSFADRRRAANLKPDPRPADTA